MEPLTYLVGLVVHFAAPTDLLRLVDFVVTLGVDLTVKVRRSNSDISWSAELDPSISFPTSQAALETYHMTNDQESG